MATRPLTPKQQRFVEEYLVDLNATQAAIRAGYSVRTADRIGAQLLGKTGVAISIRDARAALSERAQITAAQVLKDTWAVATADPRELVEVKVGCCRHCHGEGNRYQRTVGEMNRDRELFLVKGGNVAEFDEAGGIGFDPLLAPNPECPECGGDGHSRVVAHDTRKLSPKALALYAGAKHTRYGIEILMSSRDAARERLFKHLGLYELDNRQRTDPLAELLKELAGNVLGPVPDAQAPPADDEDDDPGGSVVRPSPRPRT